MNEEEKNESIKISVPLYTNQELDEFENILENDFKSVFDVVSKQVYHDRECIALQKIIEKQQKEIEELKKDISEMYYKGVVIDILQDELNINRDEAIEILENY